MRARDRSDLVAEEVLAGLGVTDGDNADLDCGGSILDYTVAQLLFGALSVAAVLVMVGPGRLTHLLGF